MKYNELEQYAETCQREADNLAFLLIKARNLMKLQSVCDFNIWWFHDISPVMLRQETIEFLVKNINKFKRKVSVKEMMHFDSIIYHKKPVSFEQFKNEIY